jgi:hypothetical protein
MAVMKKGAIVSRYNLGDDIYYVLKGDKQIHHAAILSIREFEFITLQKDTVKFAEVGKLKFRNKASMKYVKSTLIGSAGLTALHFALKKPYGDKNPQAVKGLAWAAGAGVVSTLFVLATSKTSMKIAGFKRLKYIGYDSPLYK